MIYLKYTSTSLLLTRHSSPKNPIQISFTDSSIKIINIMGSKQGQQFTCLLGIKYINGYAVLIFVVESQYLFMIDSAKINEIKKVGFVVAAPEQKQEEIKNKLWSELQQIQAIFQIGFHYYSEQYDLSLPFMMNKVQDVNNTQRKYYNQFVWNLNVAKADGQQSQPQSQLLYNFCTKIIQGYIAQYNCPLPNDKIKYVVISRRSHRKTGTRFYSRGIDDNGNVANFVETQQIVYLGQYIFSHLQIRGSVPIFFSQVGVNGIQKGLVIERKMELTKKPFHLHFGHLKNIYNRILAINLLTQKKEEEQKLTAAFEQIVNSQQQKISYLKYQYYDFHQECKNNKFQNSQALIQSLSEVVHSMGFNVYQVKSGKLIRQQNGVFRTNCLDCLDRTNYVQSRIAVRALKMFLERFSHEEINSLCKEARLLDFPVNQKYPLAKGFSQLWADNGDAISLLYTGSGSTHTDITRTGGRTFIGAINHKYRSLSRFFIQFSDHTKHQAIQKIVTPTPLKQTCDKVSDFNTTLVLSIDNIMTIQDSLQHLQAYLKRVKPTIIVVYVFQKQEMSFLAKLTCYMNSQTTDFKIWQSCICEEVEKQNYILVGSLAAQRSWMGVFCKDGESKHVAEVKHQNLTSQLKNGQALLLKMKLQQSSFVFAGVNCKSFQQYLALFDELHAKGFQIRKLGLFQSSSFLDLDYKVVMGNTCSQITMTQQQLQTLRRKYQQHKSKNNDRQATKTIHKILDFDQFGMQSMRFKSKYLREYNQGPVHFIPGGNRMVFWNQENVVLRVKEYSDMGKNGIAGVFDYQIGRARRGSVYVPE